MITIRINRRNTDATLAGLRKRLSRSEVDRLTKKAANESKKRLAAATPVRFTGKTRKAWTVKKINSGRYEVVNKTKAMTYLEDGTRAHGPVKAKRLFVPLSKRGFRAGPKAVLAASVRARARGSISPYVYGRDYILAKRVRGVKALHLAKTERTTTNRKLASIMIRHIMSKL